MEGRNIFSFTCTVNSGTILVQGVGNILLVKNNLKDFYNYMLYFVFALVVEVGGSQ